MTVIPDFATRPLGGAPAPAISKGGEPWLTPEGIAVRQAYGADDRSGLDFLDTYPGLPPFLRGP